MVVMVKKERNGIKCKEKIKRKKDLSNSIQLNIVSQLETREKKEQNTAIINL
jgi:hypothetical protein